MDFDKAKQYHLDWAVKLSRAISQRSTMDIAIISSDNCCDLGKWLYGEESQKLRQLPSYNNCIAQHKRFHIEAGKVAFVINAKKFVEAEAMLEAGTAFLDASAETCLAIRAMKHEAKLHKS